MKFGISMFPTDDSMSVVDLAPRLEDAGFESFFVPEHSHIPVHGKSAHPFAARIPSSYAHFLDPFVALSASAAVTASIKLGTAICLVAQRDPIQLAKTVASLDHLSGGRFLFGMAAGWHAEEMENHGTHFKDRWQVMEENLLAMKAIWSNDEAEFHGQHVNFDPIWSWPKPVQRPSPPILIGGEGPRAIAQAARLGDEWMPRMRQSANLAEQIQQLQTAAAKAGRRPVSVTTFGAASDASGLAKLEAAGVGRCIFTLPSASWEEVRPVLERHTSLIRSFG